MNVVDFTMAHGIIMVIIVSVHIFTALKSPVK